MTPHAGLSGLYLVVSPILPNKQLLSATEQALDGGIDILQFSAAKYTEDSFEIAYKLAILAEKHEIPFLINNNLDLARKVKAQGVHMDAFEWAPEKIRNILGGKAIVGYTVNLDMEKVRSAEQTGADYISFCSLFHRCPGNVCPIVPIDVVKGVASTARLPVFAAGGITLENVFRVLEGGVAGVVVTSAILKSKDPKQATKSFKQIIEKARKSS